jgi:tetratricopeptide (TPR) repeat protein
VAPGPEWVLVSDPSNPLAALEFFDPKSGLRAVLSSDEVSPDEAAQVADRAQAEIQSRESGSLKIHYSELRPMDQGQLSGMGWESASEKDGQPVQSVGLSALAGNQVFTLALSGADQVRDRTEFRRLFQNFFAGLQIDQNLLKAKGPAVSPERMQNYQSSTLGYRWTSPDTLWHRWTSLEAINSDPDLTLTNASEEISLFVYGAVVDPGEVSSRDLFRVFMVRLGLDPDSPDLETTKKGSGDVFTQDFQSVRLISGYDFFYRGRFFYENGRGILIATWTQNSLAGGYRKAIDRALDGLKLEPVPAGGLPQQARLQQFNARIVNQVGLLRLAEDQPLVALSYFEKANHMDPSEPLYLINCGFVYQMRNLFGPGTDHFLSQIDLIKKSGKLLAILGEMYESLHDYNRALQYYEMALQYSPHDPELVINTSDALWGIGQRTQSLEIVQGLYRKQPSARLGVYVAKTLMGLDQYSEAVDLLYSVKRRFTLNKDIGLAIIDALTFLGRHQEALAISDELLPKVSNNFEVWNARGKTQFHLKQFRMAENTLHKALELKPDDEDAKSFLSATKAFLGKADIRALQATIEPVVSRPRNLKDELKAGLVDSARAEEFPAVVHWQEEALKTNKNASWIRTQQALIEILDPRGAGLFQEFTYTFLPGFDRIFVNALEVYDSSWKLKTRWSVKEAYITYLNEAGSGSDAQMAHLPLTDLKPGDFIYFQVSRTSIENTGVIPFTHHMASQDIPVGKDILRLLTDTSSIVTEEYGPIERMAVPGGIEWTVDAPVVIRKEVFMPVYRDFGAGVLIAGKQSWEQVGRDYQNMIQHQFKSSIPVREKAFEVRGSRALDQETIFRMADWVRENIRYRDIAFGGHSLIPSLSLATLNERQGDCKDQSLLLKEMLETIGIKSRMALVNLEEPGSEALPTIQQFNHMVLYVPAGKNWPDLWLDPTDKAGARRPIALDLEGKVSLIINGDSSQISVTPVLEKDQEHQAFIAHSLYIDSTGKAEFRDSLTLFGKFGSAMRAQMISRDQKERTRYLANWLEQAIPDATINSLKVENVQEFAKPLVLIVTFTSAHYFGQSPDRIQGAFPNIWERSFMRLPKITKRHHPLRLPHETTFSWSLKVRGPDRFGISLKQASQGLDALNYIQLDQKPTTQNSSSSMRWETLSVYADASEYEGIRREWESILDATTPMILLERK